MTPGMYLICREGPKSSAGPALYVGATLDLRARLNGIFDGDTIRGGWQQHTRHGKLFVGVFALNRSLSESWLNDSIRGQFRLAKRLKLNTTLNCSKLAG